MTATLVVLGIFAFGFGLLWWADRNIRRQSAEDERRRLEWRQRDEQERRERRIRLGLDPDKQ